MNVIIIQPPFVQLNTAYPSGAYLSAFFKKLGHQTTWFDMSNELFLKIFSKEGLSKIFKISQEKALTLAQQAESKGQEETAFNLRRYINQKDQWISQIDLIINILQQKNVPRELAHGFVFSPFTARGNRMENYIQNLDHSLTTDDAFTLASYALADLADFISVTLDKNFELIRYAEQVTSSSKNFSQIESTVQSPIMQEFYIPLLKEKICSKIQPGEKNLFCISVPFSGTFSAALATGKFIKNNFANDSFVCFGGGFINTELRNVQEIRLSEYCDALSYDRGYGSYQELLESRLIQTKDFEGTNCLPIYKMRFFTGQKVIPQLEEKPQIECFENEFTSTLLPDFSDIDFSRYPRMADSTNPMHRLWNDGAWIKAYMAHGCYWHKCAFCDTTLDYVKSFKMTNIEQLFFSLLDQAQKHNTFGIHFVDEAMPLTAMVKFAKLNIENGRKLNWWGNIRFEKCFTRDIADFLSYGGLIGVSGGIEVATNTGLDAINKGTDLDSIVASCCAFKEAGILVHAYMIYGFWYENDSNIIDSMETLRQFYKEGLLDSSFWHKFTLTKHSRVYNEWVQMNKSGTLKSDTIYSRLKPISSGSFLFAQNTLKFEGENKFNKFGFPLQQALNSWMNGQNIDMPVQQWFGFPIPKPTVPKNLISKSIQKYENFRDKEFSQSIENVPEEKLYWLGGTKYQINSNTFGWIYMGEEQSVPINSPKSAYRGKGLVKLP